MAHRTASGLGWCLAAGLLLAPVAVAGPETPVDDGSALRSYYSGNGFLNRGMYDLAAAEYRKFLDADGNHEKAAIARYGLAVSLFRLQRYGEALTEIAVLPDPAGFEYGVEYKMIQGQCYLARDGFEDAADAFGYVVRSAIDHDLADDAAALLAESLYRAGRYELVVEPCQTLVTRWPESPRRERCELFWGLAEVARENHRGAADQFDGMLQRFPAGAHADQASLLLAQSLHRSEQVARAETEYAKVIQTANPLFVPDALYGQGMLMHQQNRPGEARPLLFRMVMENPTHTFQTPARFLLGRVLFDLGRFDEAFVEFEQVAAVVGDDQDDAVYWMSKCDLRLDRPQAAADRLARAAEEFPFSDLMPQITYDQAVALLRADQPDLAIDVLSGLRQQYPLHELSVEGLHLMALTEHLQQRYDRSLEFCVEFLGSHPRHNHAPALAFLAGENEFLDGDYEEAAEAYGRYLETYPAGPDVAEATFRRGMALAQLDRFDEARPLLDTVIAGAETDEAFRAALLALGDGCFQREQWALAEGYLNDYVGFGLDQPAADDALLKLGLARHRQERFAESLEAYERLIDEMQGSEHRLQAIFERGQVLVAMERSDDAALAFEHLLQEGPDSRFAPHALNHLGAIAVQRSDFVAAADHFSRVPDAPSNPDLAAEAIYQQGQALMSAERFDEAAAAFGQLESTYPDSPRARRSSALRAIGLARHGDHEQSLEQVARVESAGLDGLDGALVTALIYEKAWCQRELDQAEEAGKTYRRLLNEGQRGTLRHHALLELAELDFEAERYDAAVELLQELLADARTAEPPVEPRLQEQGGYQLGMSLYRLERHEQAAEALETFLSAYPQSEYVPSASLLCGESLFTLGQHRRSSEHLARVVEEHPDDEACEPSLLRLGESLAALQEWTASEEAFRSHRQRFPKVKSWFQAQFGLGWSQENQGRHEEAITAYRQLLDEHQGPTAARAQFQIGECMFALERYEEAARELLKVDILYAYPEWSAAALYEAGRCFEELSNPVDARRQFEQVVNKHGETQWASMAADRLESLSQTALPGR